jgi:hypothetical protein
MGGKLHLKLNIHERPIANKYREGKMKRTLKRESKVLEIAKKEAMATSPFGEGTTAYLLFADLFGVVATLMVVMDRGS